MSLLMFWLTGLVLFYPALSCSNRYLLFARAIYAYPVWIMAGLYFDIPATRIIATEGIPYYGHLVGWSFIPALISYFLFVLTTKKIKNVPYNYKRLPLQNSIRFVIFVLYLAIIPIAYPGVFGFSEQRFGSAGGLVIVFSSIIYLSRKSVNEFDVIGFLVMISTVFMVVRGERVDFILSLIVYFLISGKNMPLYKVGISIFLMLILGIIGGMLRGGDDLNFSTIVYALGFAVTNFGTAVDVVHMYLSSGWYYLNFHQDYRPLINVLSSAIPMSPHAGASSDMNFVWILRKYINNVGGGTFYIVGMMALGPVGVALLGGLYGYIFKRLYLIQNYFCVLFIAFFIQQFRVQWYGITYFGSVLFCLLIGCAFLFFLKKHGVVTNVRDMKST